MMASGRLASWLAHVPAQAARLELRLPTISGAQCLAGYMRAELERAQDAADAICEVAQDQCDAIGARTSMSVVWLDGEGRTIGTKSIRCEPENDNDDDIAQKLAGAGYPPKEPATQDGLVAQLMRHVENRERMLNIALGTNLQLMHSQLREARTEADQLRAELRRERLKRSKETEEESADTVESLARAEAVTKMTDAVITHIVPLAAARLREGMQ